MPLNSSAPFNAFQRCFAVAHPRLYQRKGMVSSINCPQIRARRTREICIEPMFENFYFNSNQRIRWLPCARIQNSIICRRSSRQCIARLIRLRSTLHPPSGSGNFAFRISRTRGFSRQSNYMELKAHYCQPHPRLNERCPEHQEPPS